ncbi:hypothetical protein TNCV_2805571 [Trichonephila clavipes]|nr:hypothetical protein TNCV_2805571 [Trichonephila clavipes]
MAQTDPQHKQENWQHGGQQLHVFHCVLHQFGDVCCSVGCAQGFLCLGFSRKTIATCGYTGPIFCGSWRADWLRVVFSDESTSICGSHDGEFEGRDSMPVNGAFRSAFIEGHSG